MISESLLRKADGFRRPPPQPENAWDSIAFRLFAIAGFPLENE
jgi:hypothetical protein